MTKKQNVKQAAPSRVEEVWLARAAHPLRYPGREQIGVVVVDNFPALGKLAALRFLEWVQTNPQGVVSLPTGKTPEHFIRWVKHYLAGWDTRELESEGIDPAVKPVMRGLHFVQMDEFYPIDPEQQNSFHYYVSKYYLEGFGLDKERALLINSAQIGIPKGKSIADVFPDYAVDLSLRTRHPLTRQERLQKEAIQQADQWCSAYEEKIRSLGGIGFFLGGIGPDGHIAFNVRGSDPFSTSRLTATNYETQAAAATDLGGIEISRKRLVITIGLATITFNPAAVAIVFAAGESKAEIVADAIQEPTSNLYPASALRSLAQARFYLTQGAACRLTQRRFVNLQQQAVPSDEQVERCLIDLSLARKQRLADLTEAGLQSDPFCRLLLEKTGRSAGELTARTAAALTARIDRGRAHLGDTCFLHIGPHHDDIMLGYLPYIAHLVRPDNNRHHFCYATSGFTAVTNRYVLGQLKKVRHWLHTAEFRYLNAQGYFKSDFPGGRDRDIFQYLDGVAAQSRPMQHEGEARRLLRNLILLLDEGSFAQLDNRIAEMIQYSTTQYPGKKDLVHIQRLKGMIREWEAELLWASFGFQSGNVHHLRMGFYQGDIFTEAPDQERDVIPIYRLFREIAPDVISVAFDPEGSGPDTHYKVLKATAEALKLYTAEKPAVKVLGYRNVWFRYHPGEANIYVPLSLHSLAVLERAFMNSFGSQKQASFPSHEYDGPFSGLIRQYQVEQYHMLKTCLGREFFYAHESPRLRAAHGFVFLKEMSADEFIHHSTTLQKQVED